MNDDGDDDGGQWEPLTTAEKVKFWGVQWMSLGLWALVLVSCWNAS